MAIERRSETKSKAVRAKQRQRAQPHHSSTHLNAANQQLIFNFCRDIVASRCLPFCLPQLITKQKTKQKLK